MHRFGRGLPLVLALLALLGCESPSVPFNPPPDPEPVPEPFDSRPPQDVYIRPDTGSGVIDAAGEAGPTDAGPVGEAGSGEAGAGDGDTDAAVILPDAGLPGEPPLPDQVLALVARPDTWVAWVREGRLYARRAAGEDGVDLQPTVDRGEVGNLTAPLTGARTRGGVPIVLVPGVAPGSPLEAVDLESGEREVTALFEPAVAAPNGADLLFVGAAAPGEARPAWQLRRNDAFQAPIPDTTGFSLPQSVTGGLSSFVFSFPTGDCLALNRDLAPIAPWRCGSTPESTLIGADDLLLQVQVDAAALVVTRATPGAVHSPPEEGEAETGRVVLEPGIDVAFRRPAGAAALSAVMVVGRTPRVAWIVEPARARRVPVNDVSLTLGAAVSTRTVRLIEWDPIAGTVELRSVAPDRTQDLPTYALNTAFCAPTASILPEDCEPVDRTCDGEEAEGLCCRARVGTAAQVRGQIPNAVLPPPASRGIFAAQTDSGLLFATVLGSTGLLLRHPANDPGGALMTVRAQWDNIAEIQQLASMGLRLLLVARSSAMEMRLQSLWYEGGMGGGTSVATDAPCDEVRAVRFTADGERARFFCPAGGQDVAPGQATGTPFDYPGNVVDVKWIVRRARGQDDLLLAAYGPDNALVLWRDGPGGLVPAGDEALPPEVAALSAEDRAEPIHLPLVPGGTIARVVERKQVQFLVDGAWSPGGGSRWPVSAFISLYEPLAFTLGDLTDPTGADAIDRTLGIFVHDLRPGGERRGRRVATDAMAPTFGVIRALGVPEFAGAPQVLRISGTQQVNAEGFDLTCD